MASHDPPDDEALLSAWCDGDAQAGGELVRRHYDAMFGFFLGKVDSEIAAELTQDTFMAMTEARDRFARQSSTRTYLFAIARWKIVEHFRRLRTQRQRLPTLDAPADEPATPGTLSSWLEGRRRESLLVQALRSLVLDDQILLELKGYEDLTLREIAEVFEVPTGTIASRIRRARARLEQAIRELADNPELAAETLTGVGTYMRAIRERARTQ